MELDLRSAVDCQKTSSTVTTIDLTSSVESTWLDFIGAAADSVDVDGASIPVEYDGSRIVLRGLGGSNVVRVAAHGNYSRSGEGLHRFVDDADDQTYSYTQYEPADARRVFACFEQPDLKAPFTFEVTAPGRLGSPVESARDPDFSPWTVHNAATFAPTLPISTYITAIAAGPYHRVAPWRPRRTHRRVGCAVPGVVGSTPRCRQRWTSPVSWTSTPSTSILIRIRSASTTRPSPSTTFMPWRTWGPVTFTEAYVFRGLQQPTSSISAAPTRDPARNGAHVVRRSRDHGLVGRPVPKESLPISWDRWSAPKLLASPMPG